VARGQCFHRPYLGCREFAARFREPDGTEAAPDELAGRTEPLGRMLFDLDYGDGGADRGRPVFFHAELQDGVLHVPQHLYDELAQRA
jgi:CRISPR-associated protein Cas5d